MIEIKRTTRGYIKSPNLLSAILKSTIDLNSYAIMRQTLA